VFSPPDRNAIKPTICALGDVSAIIFDLVGLLIDSEQVTPATILSVAAANAVPLPDELGPKLIIDLRGDGLI
jgi:beta-phosphoglucomutase-like phosphatase (HAD superfamily)